MDEIMRKTMLKFADNNNWNRSESDRLNTDYYAMQFVSAQYKTGSPDWYKYMNLYYFASEGDD